MGNHELYPFILRAIKASLLNRQKKDVELHIFLSV